MYNGSYYANKIKNTIDKIGETVTLNYKIRQGYDPISGETYENFTVNDFKMLIRKTDKTDYVKIPEGLHNKDIRKIFFYQDIPNQDVIITRHYNNKDYKIIVPPVENIFNGANIYYVAYIGLNDVQNNK